MTGVGREGHGRPARDPPARVRGGGGLLGSLWRGQGGRLTSDPVTPLGDKNLRAFYDFRLPNARCLVRARVSAELGAVMRWKEISSFARKSYMILPNDKFSRKLLLGAIMVARDKSNPVRGNLFASAIRELLGFNLDRLAPDNNIIKCAWFKQNPQTRGPTRAQKLAYICHKGLMPEYLETELEIFPDKLYQPIKEALEKLNKETHVRPGTVLRSDQQLEDIVLRCLKALIALLEVADRCEDIVCDALTERVHASIYDKLTSEVYDNLDELSTHTRVDDHYIDRVFIKSLDHEQICYAIEGRVEVELQYGSGSDQRNDMGAMMDDSYPYIATLGALTSEPDEFLDEETSIIIDTSDFYE